MSELTTGGINFGYQSPISQIYKDVEYKFKENMENKIMEAVHHFGISVDKEELIKALQYDRNQYDKGYSDGRASIVEELENQKIGHWIPVSERLPDKPYGCIVTVMDTNPIPTYDEFENIYPDFVGWDGENWNDADGNSIPFEVVAWMPLPGPYKAELKGENNAE